MNWSLTGLCWFRRWLRRWLPSRRTRQRGAWRISYPAGIVTTADGIGQVYPMAVLVAPCGQRWESGGRLPVWLRSRAEPCLN